MKIVYLHQYFVTPEMSGGTRSYEFARRLVAAGHDVHMITSDRKSRGKPYETVEAGIRVTWIPVPYSNHMGTIARMKAFAAFAVKSALVAANSKADVIFATSTPLTIAIPAVYAKWRQKAPMVFEVRDPWPEMLIGLGVIRNPILKFLARRFERFVYRNASHVIALSEGMKMVVSATGYSERDVTVIPNAADLERFDVSRSEGTAFRSQFEWLNQRKIVLYAGTIGKANGISYLVRVAQEMLTIDESICFLVIGSGSQEESVRALAIKVGTLDRNLYMIPTIPKQDIPMAFSAASVSLVLLRDVRELWTNSSNKFFDGLASGTPVVVNNVGWQSDLLMNTGAGFDLNPHNHKAAAHKLHRYLMDDVWLFNAGKEAQRLAKTQFDRNLLSTRLEQVLMQTKKAYKESVDVI